MCQIRCIRASRESQEYLKLNSPSRFRACWNRYSGSRLPLLLQFPGHRGLPDSKLFKDEFYQPSLELVREPDRHDRVQSIPAVRRQGYDKVRD